MQADGNPIDALPEDPAILRALLLSAWSQRDKVVAECHELAEQNEHLKHLVQKLTRLKFGAKSERWPEDQLQLALGDVETAIAQTQAQDERSDGRIEIDNNTVERSMRPIKLSAKIRFSRVPMRGPIIGQPPLH